MISLLLGFFCFCLKEDTSCEGVNFVAEQENVQSCLLYI